MSLVLLEEAIRDISKLHKKFSDLFYDDLFKSEFNLRKVTVNNVLNDKKFDADFLEYVERYHGELNDFYWLESDFIEKYSSLDARVRVKQKDSIYNKLIFYGEKKENGKVPIQKCLNDLLGYRLVINDFDCNNLSYKRMITSLKSELNLMKCCDRNVGGYRGSHIYFKNMNNFFYPWELQLWSSENAVSNEKSHNEHKSKRRYIEWPQRYKEGRIEKG